MSTLTKKLHVKYSKIEGRVDTCNIYTTPEEVGGSPYLALEVDGQKGYVKLGSTTDANATHLRVKKNGTTYAAWKQAEDIAPTGTYIVEKAPDEKFTFTVPNKITVVEVSDKLTKDKRYIGVTPNKAYGLIIKVKPPGQDPNPNQVLRILGNYNSSNVWDIIQPNNNSFIISWSPEINNMTPTIKDY